MLLNGADVIGFQVADREPHDGGEPRALDRVGRTDRRRRATARYRSRTSLLRARAVRGLPRRLFDQHRLPAGSVLQQPVVT